MTAIFYERDDVVPTLLEAGAAIDIRDCVR
jgi:hypothetical protein